jgi:hypothetical protein
MRVTLESLKAVPVVWLVSKKNGKIINSFIAPEAKGEMILQMIIDGHEEIREPFDNLKYLGMFDDGTSTF